MKKQTTFSLFCKWLSCGMKGNPLDFIKKEKQALDCDNEENNK